MSVANTLRATRRVIVLGVVARAALWSLALGCLTIVAMRLAGMERSALLTWSITLGALALLLWQSRAMLPPSLVAVALWAERRGTALDYALVTAAESMDAGEPPPVALERMAERARVAKPLASALARRLLPPIIVAGISLAIVTRPPELMRQRTRDSSGRAIQSPANSTLGTLSVTVTPPAYSAIPAFVLRDPSSIAALVGSRIQIRGSGSATGVRIGVDSAMRLANTTSDGWQFETMMPRQAAALSIARGVATRIIVLEPRADSLPVVTLRQPAGDTVIRDARGRIALDAMASDDIGLSSGSFEVIISSGQGESFSFRTLAPGTRTFGGARAGRLTSELILDSLDLKPGDLLHVRAIARDRNDVGVPGLGASDTRTIRVARAGEYDSLAIEAAPPPDEDKSVVSERMLILLAEALERRRPRLARPTLIDESRRIATDQTRLRKSVGAIVFSRLGAEPAGEQEEGSSGAPPRSAKELLAAANAATDRSGSELMDVEGDESPVVHVNRPLLEAYNAMWDAGRELEQAEPARALPYMRIALAAIQRARQAERIYLRGRAPVVVVDVARVRLHGKDRETTAEARRPRQALADASATASQRFADAVSLLERSPAAAIDSLQLLRVSLLGAAPDAAAALARAIDELRAGHDATATLVAARHRLGPTPIERPLTAWSGAW